MSGGTEARKVRSEIQVWVKIGLAVLGFVCTAAVAYAAIEVRHAEAVARITAIERQMEKLDAVPAAIAGIQVEQQAQRALLDRVDRRLEAMAKPK
jgi:hypothetical protein